MCSREEIESRERDVLAKSSSEIGRDIFGLISRVLIVETHVNDKQLLNEWSFENSLIVNTLDITGPRSERVQCCRL